MVFAFLLLTFITIHHPSEHSERIHNPRLFPSNIQAKLAELSVSTIHDYFHPTSKRSSQS
jgi:hypothetical protein